MVVFLCIGLLICAKKFRINGNELQSIQKIVNKSIQMSHMRFSFGVFGKQNNSLKYRYILISAKFQSIHRNSSFLFYVPYPLIAFQNFLCHVELRNSYTNIPCSCSAIDYVNRCFLQSFLLSSCPQAFLSLLYVVPEISTFCF